jgi:hypothetical protein
MSTQVPDELDGDGIGDGCVAPAAEPPEPDTDTPALTVPAETPARTAAGPADTVAEAFAPELVPVETVVPGLPEPELLPAELPGAGVLPDDPPDVRATPPDPAAPVEPGVAEGVGPPVRDDPELPGAESGKWPG